MFDKHKVIIIDEAQELSKAGKGVTLELLEKKRKGTYIILCTMAIETFDKAVQSRGHVYTFRSPSSSDIAEYLFRLTEFLNLPDVPEIEEFLSKGIFLIAENCEGSVRMAVQNLERCVFGEFWKEEQIEKEFSFLSNEKLSDLVLKILRKDVSCVKSIKDFGTKDFYYKALKTLNDAYLYSITGYIDQPWKERFAKSLKSYDLEKVISTLLEVDKGVYFREDLFFYCLSGLLKKEPSRELLRERSEVMIKESSNPVNEFKKTVRERVPREKT
jgi:DNA polymerase III gamma/tau subunit